MCDSGAFSLYTKQFIGIKTDGGRYKNANYDYTKTKEFKKYLDDYIEFLHKNKKHLEVYVGLDIIGSPKLTWEIQKYMESFGLSPLPVFHIGEDFKWLKKYVDNYEYIGIGGLTKDIPKKTWIVNMGNPIFTFICDTPNRLPRVKVHGFAMTSPELLTNYPFYSADSTSWMQYGKYGLIIVPKRVPSKYNYSCPPWVFGVTERSPKAKKDNYAHFDNLPIMTKKLVLNYMEEKGFTVEEIKKDYTIRDDFNLEYFLDLEKSIPEWPWPWKKKQQIRGLW